MSDLREVMLCKHKKTKKKLISNAVEYNGKHKQSFDYVECCCFCGKQVKPPKTEGEEMMSEERIKIKMELFKSVYLQWSPVVKDYISNVAFEQASKAANCFDAQFPEPPKTEGE